MVCCSSGQCQQGRSAAAARHALATLLLLLPSSGENRCRLFCNTQPQQQGLHADCAVLCCAVLECSGLCCALLYRAMHVTPYTLFLLCLPCCAMLCLCCAVSATPTQCLCCPLSESAVLCYAFTAIVSYCLAFLFQYTIGVKSNCGIMSCL